MIHKLMDNFFHAISYYEVIESGIIFAVFIIVDDIVQDCVWPKECEHCLDDG